MRDESSDGVAAADSLAEAAVIPLLRGRFGRPYRHLVRCESTQRELPPDAPEGAVVATDEQTAGRGRLGRRWIAAPSAALLFSINLRPRLEQRRWPELTLLAALACVDAVHGITGVEATVKLPNDLLVHGRKLAGILAEAREDRVVLGIGVNVNQEAAELPEGDTPPTSLRVELGRTTGRAELLASILWELELRYDRWLAPTEGAVSG